MKRDDVIKQVATAVGDKHRVDLKNYDLLILVEIYQVSGEGIRGVKGLIAVYGGGLTQSLISIEHLRHERCGP
jgi:tRNA acetyltransferase TAN1